MNVSRHIVLFLFFLLFLGTLQAEGLLVPMDLQQSNHLKAYGIAYLALQQGIEVEWLLNYRGGSFLVPRSAAVERELLLRGVAFEMVAPAQREQIMMLIETGNMETIRLEKAPKISIYAPPNKQAWDDAVLLALDYAEIPYKVVWDAEVLSGEIRQYDWIHLHHEDFTGQYGKFWANYRQAAWYHDEVEKNEKMAARLGFAQVSLLKKAVASALRDYVAQGGFLFAMCSATDTIDLALASLDVDICPAVFDGTPVDPQAQKKLNFANSFAFENFELITDPYVYEYSTIDLPPSFSAPLLGPEAEHFTLFEFSAKYDPVPTMLTQNHVSAIKGFMGQTTGFRKQCIKNTVVVLAEAEGTDQVKYLHGNYGKGTFTFLAGHDPEDYQHYVNDPPTQLDLHKQSPGYRLILNNILFPAAKKKKLKT